MQEGMIMQIGYKLAAELGDGLFATDPDGDLLRNWRKLGDSGLAYAEVPLAWAPDEDTAAQAVLEKTRPGKSSPAVPT
jgi:hypothetical protein